MHGYQPRDRRSCTRGLRSNSAFQEPTRRSPLRCQYCATDEQFLLFQNSSDERCVTLISGVRHRNDHCHFPGRDGISKSVCHTSVSAKKLFCFSRGLARSEQENSRRQLLQIDDAAARLKQQPRSTSKISFELTMPNPHRANSALQPIRSIPCSLIRQEYQSVRLTNTGARTWLTRTCWRWEAE